MQRVALVKGSRAEPLAEWLEKDAQVAPTIASEDEAATLLRRGRVVLVLGGSDALTYRYDPKRPDSAAVRLRIDDRVQRKAGRADPCSRATTPPRRRAHATSIGWSPGCSACS